MKGQLKLISGQKLQSPIGLNTRPTTSLIRESLMNIVGKDFENKSLLDLFSGSGIISCEAIQRNINKVVAIESDKKIYQLCSSNISKIANNLMEPPEINVIHCDAIQWLKNGYLKQKKNYGDVIPKNGFDFIYLDPPYALGFYSTVLKHLLSGQWINKNSLVICESSLSEEIELSGEWTLKDKRCYGKNKLSFLTPSQELHFLYDIGSKH